MDENLKKKLIEDFNLSKMSKGEQEEMIDKIGTMLFEAVLERSLDDMDEDTLYKFENELSDPKGDYDIVIAFLKKNVKDFNDIVSTEMARLKRATAGIFA